MTLVCVPITVESVDRALADAAVAAEHGADLVELRVDGFYDTSDERLADICRLVAECPLATIVTCRHESEGGESDLPSVEVVGLYEQLAGLPRPPRYVDIELDRTASHEQALAAIASGDTGVIVSMHNFEGRPADLTRKLSRAYSAEFATVVKVAYRARSLRDNLELFEILRDAPKPTIALGMGDFGLMSRVLAPKFGGLLTFAALRDESATAPGQPTLDELFNLYRFRKIGPETKVYGVIGWPVTHSMSPLVHNAGFEAIGWDGVYLPMPVAADEKDAEASYASFKATVTELMDSTELNFAGGSITLPHKLSLKRLAVEDDHKYFCNWSSYNTLVRSPSWPNGWYIDNTDVLAINECVRGLNPRSWEQSGVAIIGSGGVATSTAEFAPVLSKKIWLYNRTMSTAKSIAERLREITDEATGFPLSKLGESVAGLFINCTPVGMKDGPDPEGMSIPVHELAGKLPPETVFFDTVYNPIETPMLKAAKEHGFRTIDGVKMFVAQAEFQFQMWTDQKPPGGLFDRLVRERLTTDA